MNPYQKARDEGYSHDEIIQFLGSHPKYADKMKLAREQGYSDDDIRDYFSGKEKKPKRSLGEKATRLATQFGVGAAESALLPYELAVAPLAMEGGQEAMGDLFTRDILSDVYPAEEGDLPGPKPRELKEPIDIGVRSLLEKATGADLHPEGVAEKAAHWAGFLKNPSKIVQSFFKPKELMKAIAPTGTEAMRGLGAGVALEAAEQGEFGPIGTMAAAIVGDVSGAGIAGVGKGTVKFIKDPKKYIAETAAAFTPKDKLQLQKEVIQEFRDAGIQADLGTITDSNLVKMTQSRLAQSSLTGKALQEMREQLTTQIKDEYGELARKLGEEQFITRHEAGGIAKQAIKDIRDLDLKETRKLYEQATLSLKEGAAVDSANIATHIENLEKKLKPGSIKSQEQRVVLDTINKIKEDIYNPTTGKIKFADVKELMNNKIAISDLINYETQGGAKQHLKGIVAELDKAIKSHALENPTFGNKYTQANKRFGEHADTFRNKSIASLLKQYDPEMLMNKMNTIQGIQDLERILHKTDEGKKVMDGLKRLKLEDVVGKNLVDSTTKQIKLGTFSKLLEKGKNKEIIEKILGPESFKRLERLQKNAGRLADSINRFYNASQSAVTAIDVALITKGMNDFLHVLSGNPWPLMRTGATLAGGRQLSKLIANPEFLKLTEDAMLASEKGKPQDVVQAFMKLKPYLMQLMQETSNREDQ